VKALRLAWHGVVGLAFLFAGGAAVTLATGGVDPLGSPYYGVVMSWREPLLFASLAALQLVCVVDAVVLGWRRRQVWWCAGLAAAALTVPLLLMVAIARLDLWRYERRTLSVKVIAALLSLALLALAFRLRGWAWAVSATRSGTPAALAAAFLTGALASCASPTGPTADLTGEWGYSFSADAAASACPTAPPGFRAGCGGGGTLTLVQDGTRITGSAILGGSCQSCGTVGDFRDARRSVSGSWRGGDIQMDIGECRYTAAVPEGSPALIGGTVTCTFGGIDSRGNWTMSR
jgi:hypothetical protein